MPQSQHSATAFELSLNSQYADFVPLFTIKRPTFTTLYKKTLAIWKLPVICATSASTDCTITHCDFAHAHTYNNLGYYWFDDDVPKAYCLSQVTIHRLPSLPSLFRAFISPIFSCYVIAHYAYSLCLIIFFWKHNNYYISLSILDTT